LFTHIKQEINALYSIQIDKNTDITLRTRFSIILRFVYKKYELVERFVGFYNVSEDHSAKRLFNLINSVLH